MTITQAPQVETDTLSPFTREVNRRRGVMARLDQQKDRCKAQGHANGTVTEHKGGKSYCLSCSTWF
jgi:hypothetical protein